MSIDRKELQSTGVARFMRAENQVATACYVLTLDSPGGKRYESAKHQLDRFSIQANFVQGIRFSAGETSPLYSPRLNLIHMKRQMTPGEISVYLGHRKIWQQAIDDGAERALVFEDDFSRCFEFLSFSCRYRSVRPGLAAVLITKNSALVAFFQGKRLLRFRKLYRILVLFLFFSQWSFELLLLFLKETNIN